MNMAAGSSPLPFLENSPIVAQQHLEEAHMQKLRPGDRIKLFGGYDMFPPWLKARECYFAKVLRFIDNKIERRKDDSQLSVIIEFDDELELKGLKGKFGLLLGRWEGQLWETKGVVHVYLLDSGIMRQEEMTRDNSRWVESHASYEKISP